MTHFKKFCSPQHIFGTGEARHFKFGSILIVMSTSMCMVNYPQMGCVQSQMTCKHVIVCQNGTRWDVITMENLSHGSMLK